MERTELSKVLILGGCGFVGRNLVYYLVQNRLCSYIKIVDKSQPLTSFFHTKFIDVFENSIVEFQQADLTKQPSVTKAFKTSKMFSDSIVFDFVFNLAAETRFGQDDSLYESRCTKLSQFCATAALEFGCRRYLELSTSLVYEAQGFYATNESGVINPWTRQAYFKRQAEIEVTKLGNEGLDYVILRPAFIYGSGDSGTIMTRLICAACYTTHGLNEVMSLLWDGNMKLNCVHVLDVCKALWHCCDQTLVPRGSVWNMADKSDLHIHQFNEMLKELFDIKCTFQNIMISTIARSNLRDVVDLVNSKHLLPWDNLCQRFHVANTPLSPYMNIELLQYNHLYIDGTAIESTGFAYEYPIISSALLSEQINDAIATSIFPNVLTSRMLHEHAHTAPAVAESKGEDSNTDSKK